MIRIPRSVYEAVIRHLEAGYPHEACGVLAGRGGRVLRFFPAENAECSSVDYAIDPREQIAILRSIKGRKMDLLGIVHSHVASAPSPSLKDRELASDPGVFHLIISFTDPARPRAEACRIREGQASKEELVIE